MPPANLLTDAEIQRRLDAARSAERKARARIARLKRTQAGVSRRVEMQRLCTLGRAVTVWCQQNERVMSAFKSHLNGYISRETDKEALRGTPYAVSEPPSSPAPSSAGENDNG